MRAAISLDLADYPAITEAVEKSLTGRLYTKSFGLVLYHCDVVTTLKKQKKRKAAKQTGAARKKLKRSQLIAKAKKAAKASQHKRKAHQSEDKGKGKAGLQPVAKSSGEESAEAGVEPDSKPGGEEGKQSDGQQVGEGKGEVGVQLATALSNSHLLDLLPAAATRYFQHVCDRDAWYSVSTEFIEAGGLEDLEARVNPGLERVSGMSAAAIAPEILNGLTDEEKSELLGLQLQVPAVAVGHDGGFARALARHRAGMHRDNWPRGQAPGFPHRP